MIAAFDVDYDGDRGHGACVGFSRWSDSEPTMTHTKVFDGIAPYEAGAFYKREMPCIVGLIEAIDRKISCIVVDSYVMLGEKKGLGMHLYEHYGSRIPVIGVAKTAFGSQVHCREVYRGNSQKPLYITAAGISIPEAVSRITWMHGRHRIPRLLRMVDGLSREWGQTD